jgi:hypothetical protein
MSSNFAITATITVMIFTAKKRVYLIDFMVDVVIAILLICSDKIKI